MSRPKYMPTEAHLKRVEEGAARGLNEKEIAKSLGISVSTFQRNKDHFRPHLKKGHEKAMDGKFREVESTLLKKALGYDYTETSKETKIMADGTRQVTIREIKKHQPPSDTAMIFVLVNRIPDRWQSINRHHIFEVEHIGPEESRAFMKAMSGGIDFAEEAKKIIS